jgi:diguanylate cyclase (GGDEF)-like protein
MLNTAQISLQDVLLERRRQLKLRLMASTLLAICFGVLVGWHWIIPVTLLYLTLQLFEIYYFFGNQKWFPQARPYDTAIALAALTLSSVLFGAPTLILAHALGSWGAVGAVYVLSGGILNAVLTTIGWRPAFQASVLPFFLYLFALPFVMLFAAHPPSPIVVVCLTGAGLFLMLNVWQLWILWSRSKAGEITAVGQYVEERDDNEQRLRQMTQRDAMTGLLNRDMLQARLAQNARDGASGAMLMIDLDGFKYVNDTLGHTAGDQMLREIGRRMQRAAGTYDTAARLGGDEFALLLPGLADPAAAQAMAERLIAAISAPVTLDGQRINIGASVGIVIHPMHGEDAEQLYVNADLALYQAKAEGRHCARIYQPALRANTAGKVLRDTELGLALERGEFEMFYQPQVRLADGVLTGAEALLRWRHPQRGLLTPAGFLDALEGGRLSARVGAWAIETACRQAALWRTQGLPDFHIGVNLFGAQIRAGNLVEWVTEACDKAGLPFDALEIEITENVMLGHEDEIILPLQELRARGIGVAFDDYGTGFASLSMLTRYPVSRLKIDQSFTRAICDSAPEAAIVHAVLALARALHMEVTAEGVETEAQAAALARDGCDAGQGYYFGAPMTARQFGAAFGIGLVAERAAVGD